MAAKESVQEWMFSKIEQWQQSGLSQKGWCEQQGLKYHVFHYWYKRWRSNHSTPAAAAANVFIPLALQSSTTVTAGCMELVLTDGRRLLFHQPVSSDYLKALIS